MRFAAEYPDRVATLILNGTIAYSDPAGDAERRRTADAASLPQDRKDAMRRHHGEDWPAVNAVYQALHAREEFQRYYDLRRIARRVRTPTLFLRGDIDEPVHPVRHSVVLHERIPGSWLAIYPNTPFNAMRARPQEAWSLIRTFIAGAQGQKAAS
jgi:pimeloyl-ACP methyl ester carboxylesterase